LHGDGSGSSTPNLFKSFHIIGRHCFFFFSTKKYSRKEIENREKVKEQERKIFKKPVKQARKEEERDFVFCVLCCV
jgi:hypothetical protein